MLAAHLLLFAAVTVVVWMLSGVLIAAVERVAKRFDRPGFAVAFFLLGFLTSVSEISVAVNAAVEGVPQVSAGNLIGGCLVIFLFIIPLLAYAGGGIPVTHALGKRPLQLILLVSFLPAVFILDGQLTRPEGLLMILLYVAALYTLEKRESVSQTIGSVKRGFLRHRASILSDLCKILIGAIVIFLAGNVLVGEAVILAKVLHVPASFLGLMLLSLGTNIPELSIAIRCITRCSKDVAFGDYLGSAAANTPILGALILFYGEFSVERTEFLIAFPFLAVGLVAFYLFARSQNVLSRREGAILLVLYIAFLAFQLIHAPAILEAAGTRS